jgi:hypothetical protein
VIPLSGGFGGTTTARHVTQRGVGESERKSRASAASAQKRTRKPSLSLTRLSLLCVVELDSDATRMVLLFDHRVIAR